ncbi:hypothetical protein O9X98_13925 [Agrobacterium salinitolerans]|nr:hypothetical protein [Agrobacterium salinitolerans]
MRVEVEVPVIGWGHAKAGHAYKDIFASVPRTFEIPEYDLSEVPIVLAYHEACPNGRERRSEYFGVGGKLYRDRLVSANDAFATTFHYQRYGAVPHPFFAATSDRYDKRTHYIRKEGEALAPKKMIPAEFGEYIVKGRGDVPFRIPTFQELSLKWYNEKAVEEQVAEFSKRMERMIVVGGNLLVEEQEPIIRIDGHISTFVSPRFGGYMHLRPEPDRLLKLDDWNHTPPIAFISLSEFATLEDRVASLEKRLGSHVEFEYPISHVEIDDARYLRASGEGATLMVAGDLLRRAFVEHISQSAGEADYQKKHAQGALMALDPALLAVMQRLVPALHAADEFEIPDALEESISTILDMHARSDLSSAFKTRTLLDYAADAFEVWQNREIGFEVGPSPALRA